MTLASSVGPNPNVSQSYGATVREGRIELDRPVDWPDGARLLVTPVLPFETLRAKGGHAIIVGFGLAGRCVADLLKQCGVSYTIIEKNPVTVETQRALGRSILEGDAKDAKTLTRAGLNEASILALTIPDEEAVLATTTLARRLRPELFIIARTQYASMGMKAAQLGADAVVKAEQAVALQFYDKLSRHVLCWPEPAQASD